MIYSLKTIQRIYEKDRINYLKENIDIKNSGLKQVDNEPKVANFLSKVLNNLSYFKHLIEDKIDNYMLGRLFDIAESFDVDKVVQFLKQHNCFI